MKNNLLPLYFTNFFGVFNDNLLKGLICLIGVYWVAEENASVVIMLATGFLVLPFILFSPYAGFLSKTLNKQKFVVYLKIGENFIMLLAAFGFWSENLYIVMLAMFLMGLQSTFFSPMKFALIKDIGGIEKSSIGTGTIEMTTFLGVLLGTFLAGILTDIEELRILWITVCLFSVSFSGLFSALLIRAVEPKPLTIKIKPMNFVKYIIRKHKWSKYNVPGLNTVVFGLSMFWLIASLIQLNLFVHCPITMGLSGTQTGLILALVAISIGLGSFLSGVAAKKRVETGLIPIGGIGFVLSIFLIYILNPGTVVFTILIAIAAFMAGFMKTPLNAWMQVHVKGRKLGDAIAYNNLINFIFILVSAGIFGIAESNYGSHKVFLIVGILAVFMILYLFFKIYDIKESLKRILKF